MNRLYGNTSLYGLMYDDHMVAGSDDVAQVVGHLVRHFVDERCGSRVRSRLRGSLLLAAVRNGGETRTCKRLLLLRGGGRRLIHISVLAQD